MNVSMRKPSLKCRSYILCKPRALLSSRGVFCLKVSLPALNDTPFSSLTGALTVEELGAGFIPLPMGVASANASSIAT